MRGDGPLDCADYRSLRRLSWPLLRARARQPKESMDACVIDPESRYRGAENQLYRVEIHRSGTVGDGATFVWSRENGSVLFPVLRRSDDGTTVVVELETLGRDERSGLQPGDAVQLVDDVSTLRAAGRRSCGWRASTATSSPSCSPATPTTRAGCRSCTPC
nr:DUF6519 domain-containing protein [Tessaracoccus coleopterorum]